MKPTLPGPPTMLPTLVEGSSPYVLAMVCYSNLDKCVLSH